MKVWGREFLPSNLGININIKNYSKKFIVKNISFNFKSSEIMNFIKVKDSVTKKVGLKYEILTKKVGLK